MFCTKCGNLVEDGTKFCPSCGQPMQTVDTSNATEQVSNEGGIGTINNSPVDRPEFTSVNSQQGMSDGDIKPGKKLNIPLVVGIIGLIAVIAVGGFLGWKYLDKQKRMKFDVTEYFDAEFEGYDGYGKATVTLDEEKLLKRVAEAIDGSKSKAKSAFKKEGEKKYNPEESFYDVITWEVDKTEELKNGDEIKVKIKVDEDAAKEIGIKIEDSEKTFKVEGLKELTEVDPFAKVEVTFEGNSPAISASYEDNGDDKFHEDCYVYFSFDKSSGIKSEEKVVLNCSVDEETAMEAGYKLTQTSKEYTAPKTDSYVDSIDQISADTLTKLQGEAKKVVEDYFEDYKERISQSDLKYEGIYLASYTYDGDNQGYIVYSATVKSKEKEFKPTKVYFPVGFESILDKIDGTQEYDEVKDYIAGYGETGLEFGWSEVYGYTDLKVMKKDLFDYYIESEYYVVDITPAIDPDASSTSSETPTEETTTAAEEETTSEAESTETESTEE